jgi:hypothetical protein
MVLKRLVYVRMTLKRFSHSDSIWPASRCSHMCQRKATGYVHIASILVRVSASLSRLTKRRPTTPVCQLRSSLFPSRSDVTTINNLSTVVLPTARLSASVIPTQSIRWVRTAAAVNEHFPVEMTRTVHSTGHSAEMVTTPRQPSVFQISRHRRIPHAWYHPTFDITLSISF